MIAILLATYNSEKYICNQIDSILQQSYKEWKIYVRDDGSSDGTISIIKSYMDANPEKIELVSDFKGTLKSYHNFVELMSVVNADYYMFCDHDDVWLPHKIEVCVNRMKEIEQKRGLGPIVVHTDMKVVDNNLNVISDSFWRYSKLLHNHVSFWELVCCNCVNGCTMLFNKRAKECAKGYVDYCMMHDSLVAQSVAAANGIISAIETPTVLYRQHQNNVIGATNPNLGYFVTQINHLKSTYYSNKDVWKNAYQIKKAPFFYYVIVKFKITVLRFMMH